MKPALIVNLITFSRVPLAFIALIFFQPEPMYLTISFAAVALAFATDLLDGFAARQLKSASLEGQLWDSLADKAVYIAVFVAFATHSLLWPVLAWALIFRDVALYVLRIIHYKKIEVISQQKRSSRVHGFFVYSTILTGYFSMHSSLHSAAVLIEWPTNMIGLATLLVGVHNLWQFKSKT